MLHNALYRLLCLYRFHGNVHSQGPVLKIFTEMFSPFLQGLPAVASRYLPEKELSEIAVSSRDFLREEVIDLKRENGYSSGKSVLSFF